MPGQRRERRGAGAVADEARPAGGQGRGRGVDLGVGDGQQDDVGVRVGAAAERALDLEPGVA